MTMDNILSRIATPVLFAAALSLGACKTSDKTDDMLAQDSSLTRDLDLANADTLAQPQLKDVPVTSEPVVRQAEQRTVERRPAPTAQEILTPRRAPRRVAVTPPVTPAPDPAAPTRTESGNTVTTTSEPGSEGSLGTIASGSVISLYSGQRVCTNTNDVGDRFTASVAESVQGSNGVAIPAGATAIIEISAVKRSSNPNDNIELEFVVRSIAFNGRTYPVSSEVTYAQVDKVRDATRGEDARKVATGAAIGAIAGQIFGRKTKSTVIGAATGAAAGAVAAAVTAKVDGCVPNGGRISLRLSQAMQVQQSD